LRISDAMSPATSATPTPIMTTRMIPNAVNPMKLLTNEVNRYRTPSMVSRPWTRTVSCTTW
jgi:hypothetical protein